MIEMGDGEIARRIANNRCPFCMSAWKPINVRGQDQCSICHKGVNDCCQGEVCQAETEPEE